MRYSNRDLFRLSRAAIGTALMATAFAGCSGPSSSSSSAPPSSASMAATCLTDKPAPLAVVIGERSNVPSVTLPSFVSTLLENAANAGQQISFVRVDGQPKIFTLPVFSSTAGNAAARNQDVVNYLNSYVPPILNGKLHAQAAQANVLTALDLAANATGPDGNIIVIDSGLQTVAPLDYRQGILMSPPSDLVTFLQQRQLLPDLSGRHVLLSGFGYTAAPQPTLNEAQRDNVVSQWEAIVKAGGGCVTSDPVPDTTSAIAGLPPVGIVTPPPTPAFRNCGTITLEDAGSVGFTVGKWTFRDPPAAQTTLSQLATTLRQGTEHITVIGSTSSEGGDGVNDPLSLKRAQAVTSILTSLHVPASRITTVGDGSHWPGRVNDLGPGGVLLPGPAERDREVIIQLPQCSGS